MEAEGFSDTLVPITTWRLPI